MKLKFLLAALFFIRCLSGTAAEEMFSYNDLIKHLMDGKEIRISGAASNRLSVSGKAKELESDNLLKLLEDTVGQFEDMLKRDANIQVTVIGIVSQLDVDFLDRDHPLVTKIFQMYCKLLNSDDSSVVQAAFNAIVRRRTYENNLERHFDQKTAEIVAHFVEKNPEFGDSEKRNPGGHKNAISILGMSGHPKAGLPVLKSLEGKVPGFELSRQAALARLGDKEVLQSLIEKYENERVLLKKGYIAIVLGQTNAEAGLRVLSRDLRLDVEIQEHGGFGLNQMILAGMCRANTFPVKHAKIWGLGSYKQDDFDAAEAWAQKEFSAKWDMPKPPVRRIVPVKFKAH